MDRHHRPDHPARGSTTLPLRFRLNPDGFLCEGTPVTDASGNVLFEPTAFTTETGDPVDRPMCEFAPRWDRNNTGQRMVTIPATGGLVTAPCTRAQAGPLRDCGFEEQTPALTCAPGAPVTLSCAVPGGAEAQVLRVCEASSVLGTGVACAFRDSLANTIVGAAAGPVSFTCPSARDGSEPGGRVAKALFSPRRRRPDLRHATPRLR